MAFRSYLCKICGLCLILVLAGCNKIRLGYEYADWLVIYSVEDNFDLDKAQRGHLKEDVAAYFHWHRGALLPRYADLLLRVADSLKAGLRADGVDSVYRQYQILYGKTMEPVVDPALSLLTSLDSAQVEVWIDRQQKKNQKLRKDFSGARDENLERRYRKTLDEIEDWTGRLSGEQKKQIHEWSRALPWNGDLWLENRERLQVRLAGLLRKKAPKEELRKFLEDYFVHPDRIRTREYDAKYREYEAAAKAMILRIHAILTPEQQKHFVSEVERLAQNLRNMSRVD
jgi:hypothetical protein